MSFPEKVANEALLSCERCCCICHKFCGTKIELHHIKQAADGGENTLDNCIPLCFDCHADMGNADPKHPKGKHYTESELKGHRDKWYDKVNSSSVSIPNATIVDADIKLFQEICNIFTGDIRVWLSKQDMGGAHPSDIFTPLVRLQYECNDPFFEFLNVEFEKLKGNLISSVKAFNSFRGLHTFVRDLGGQQYSVTRQWLLNHEGWKPKNLSYEKAISQYAQEATDLNELSSNVWNSYLEFVRQGRRLLK